MGFRRRGCIAISGTVSKQLWVLAAWLAGGHLSTFRSHADSSTSVCVFAEKPSVPLDFNVGTCSSKSVSLNWKPPQSDGGSEIFNYVVEYR